jgi:hypothetical protein
MKARMLSALLAASICFVGCGEQNSVTAVDSAKANVSLLQNSIPAEISLKNVVDTYVVGSRNTDLQRERVTEMLIGSTVAWTFTIFDVAREGERYRVSSELMSSALPDGIGKFGVVAYVFPRGQSDQHAIEKLTTGDPVKVKGLVQSVNLRTVLVLSPAVLAD